MKKQLLAVKLNEEEGGRRSVGEGGGGRRSVGEEEEEEEEQLQVKLKVWRETKKLWIVAGPAIFTRFSTFGITIISQAFIGHIGSTELAAYALVMTVLLRFANGVLVNQLFFYPPPIFFHLFLSQHHLDWFHLAFTLHDQFKSLQDDLG